MKSIKSDNPGFKRSQKDLKQKMSMFDRLPDQCLSCKQPFDKKNKEQVKTWFVTVKSAENKVNLWCPTCWQAAIDTVKDYMEKKND